METDLRTRGRSDEFPFGARTLCETSKRLAQHGVRTYTRPMTSRPEILILGGSARAAAGSALRAGLQPICADRFGDEDLRRIARVLPVDDYPSGLLAAVESLPPTPWIYTGSLENEPTLIAAISRRHPLLGNPADVLHRVRDPFWLERTLRKHDLLSLRVRTASDPSPSDIRWLMKPLRSGGGLGVRIWDGCRNSSDMDVYLQEHRHGQPMSALFVAWPDEVRFIGLCQQLIGYRFGAPTEFGYAGSIGPIEVCRGSRERIERLGQLLAKAARLRGLFGIDFILADDVPWLTEVNPRYTASVEVLERAWGLPIVAWHVSACTRSGPATESSGMTTPDRVVGKQIVYATKNFVAPNLNVVAFEMDSLADIPTPESHVATGWPICTVFAEATNSETCRQRLEQATSKVFDAIHSLQD